MKRFAAFFASFISLFCFTIQSFAWGDVAVETAPAVSSRADSRLLILMAVAAAVLLISLGTTISLRKQYLSEEEEENKDKQKTKKKKK